MEVSEERQQKLRVGRVGRVQGAGLQGSGFRV